MAMKRVLVLGMGLVGKMAAQGLQNAGIYTIGATTTPEKTTTLSQLCDEVVVLRGSEWDKVDHALAGCDGVLVCAGPTASQAQTPEQRQATYRDILVETAHSILSAPFNGHVVALSAFAVYGDAANHLPLITEESPLTDDLDASPATFQEMERLYMAQAGERCCIFRCPDIYGGDEMPASDKIKLAHQFMGGKVPFSADALYYRLHVADAGRGMVYALQKRLAGIYNLTHAQTPPSNETYFNGIADEYGLPALTFLNQIKAPAQPISTAKLAKTGFKLEVTTPVILPLS